MTVEELEDMIAYLRDEVAELRNQVRLLEDENAKMFYEIQSTAEYLQSVAEHQCGEFNEVYTEIYDIKRDLAKHCQGFHSALIIGGGKDESNIS